MRIFFITLFTLTLPMAASAGDYKPVTCPAAKAYVGAASPDFDIASQLDNLPAPSPDKALESSLAGRLHEGLTQALTATKASAISAAVIIPGKGIWSEQVAANGAIDPGRDMFFWASAGKSFTAVAILQMAEEGRLKLDDPVSTWIKGVPNGDAITIRHLLTHTSGLFSSNEDLNFHKAPHRLTLTEDLKILNQHGAIFCPGENWHYSNSGYALLGQVLEQIDQKPYSAVIQTRIIDRLGLKRMRAISAEDALKDVVWPVSAGTEPAIDPREPGAAGGIVASAHDMAIYAQALLSGQLLKGETVKAMSDTLYPMFGQPLYYGEGVMVYQLPDGVLWIGHSGGAPGVKAVFAYSMKHKAYVAVAIAGDQGAEATANLLLRALP